MLYFMFATPKRHILGRNGVFWRILRQNPSRALGCSELQEPKKTEKLTRFWCAKSRMRGDETPGRIVTNFCTGVGVPVARPRGGLGGLNPPTVLRGHSRDLRRTASFGVFSIKILPGALAVASCKNPPKKLTRFGAQSHACAETKRLGGS